MQILKIFYFVLILHLILGNIRKFLVEKPHGGGGGGGKHPSPVSLGLK